MAPFSDPDDFDGDLYTYGYGKGGNLADLRMYSVDLDAFVVDVRYSPSSRNPTWRKANLRNSLGTMADVHADDPYSGMPRYVHLQSCGNENYKGDGPTEIHKPKTCVHRLSEALDSEFGVILLCYCPDPNFCHRSEVVELLAEHDVADGACHLRPRQNPSQRSLM